MLRTRTTGCALALGVLLPLAAHAQATGRITGVVTSDAGRPVPYAQIAVQSTSFRAVTDTDGRFRIVNVPAGQYTVHVAALGHVAKDAPAAVTAGGTATVDVTLSVLAAALQQVVVVGYGEQRKGEVTGSVASVSAAECVPGPSRDAASLIAGKVAGLGVTTPTGDPRRGTQITLRGVTTIQGNTNPLVIVDGVPGSLETVPANDIESISVLKDGSAAAVYGSRASNGVILITTKRQQGNKPTLTYDGFASAQTIYKRPDFLTADDYRQLTAAGKAKFEDLGASTDWQSQLLRANPLSQRHNVSMAGGSGPTNYTASLTYD